METKKKTTNEKIAELKKRIIGTKDPKLTEQLLNQLLGLHKQSLHTPVELEVPCSDVKETLDFGACKISRTIRGYLLEAKGGLYTFVEHRMSRICVMLDTLFQMNADENKDEELFDAFRDSILYNFQALIFASMNEASLFEIATNILSVFNKYCTENYTNAEAPERSENDYKEDAESEATAKAIEILAESPLPSEE